MEMVDSIHRRMLEATCRSGVQGHGEFLTSVRMKEPFYSTT